MVLEYLSIAALFLNDFFAQHIIFISHVLAAVFLVITETTINMRIITPMLEAMQDMVWNKIPFMSNIITTIFFIIWATAALFIYQAVFKWLLVRYEDHLTFILGIVFVIVTIAVNIKYRD